MVGEFPELQGLIGGYLARAQGEDARVADAIRDHYKPVGQGDEVPTAPVTVAVSLAERLYVLSAFFDNGIEPTGSKDPFALRRAALGAIQIILVNGLRFSLENVLVQVLAETRGGQPYVREDALRPLLDFFADRLKVQQREAGVRHDLIDAVFAQGGEDDLVRLLARVRALQAFVGSADGANLLAGYKRAANILRIEEKKDGPDGIRHAELGSASTGQPKSGAQSEEWTLKHVQGDGLTGGEGAVAPHPSAAAPLPPSSTGGEGAEAALIAALDSAEPAAAAAVAAEDFPGAMRALAALRAPIDAFFEHVTVNDPDPAIRAARLALLARIRNAVHQVADFSRIEG